MFCLLLSLFAVLARAQVVTITVTTTQTQTQTITPSPSPSPSPTSWSTAENITDLSSFNITSFPGPKSNVQIVSSLLRVFYPENSSSPSFSSSSGFPKGGSQFYASPLGQIPNSISTLSLTYSVWFPQNFTFVKGGKLPGLYGGSHTGCSGGSSAYTCFSTRFMWRANGLGELYLYAPRGSQSPALCADQGNVCSDDYGTSIGRGSWTFNTGNWTRISQVVRLNTPGLNDGGIRISVDGVDVYGRDDIYYRSDPASLLESEFAVGDEVVLAEDDDDDEEGPVGFTGLFFSTFFGGHDQDWATPRDQYVWFRDFEMEVIA